MKVSALISPQFKYFLSLGQLYGFNGSSGPSHQMMLASSSEVASPSPFPPPVPLSPASFSTSWSWPLLEFFRTSEELRFLAKDCRLRSSPLASST
jgi:hypothetical protein